MEALAKAGGLLMIATAGLQFTLLLYRVTVRRIKAARLDGEFLQLLKDLSANAATSSPTPGESNRPGWQGKRKFEIAWREFECPNGDICSFYLTPCDKKPLPIFRPGRFLTFELNIPGQSDPVMRCYSLSDSPNHRRYYRITVKKVPAPPKAPPGTPPGLSSNHFHDNMRVGDIVDVMAPAGDFYLDQNSSRPVVLIAGGVGITPLLSMLNWMSVSASKREVWLFYGVTNRNDHAMYEHFKSLRHTMPNFHMVTFYSTPTPSCRLGIDYDASGYVTVDSMKQLLRARNYKFYVCGPPPMMKIIMEGLQEWGVPQDEINTEAFGPASLSQADKPPSAAGSADDAKQKLSITFSKSDKTVEWTPSAGTLLDLAEASGVKARFACRAGNCGTCSTAVSLGEVEYDQPPTKTPAEGSCLLCVARPKSDLTLDL